MERLDPSIAPVRIRPTRLVKHPHHFVTSDKWENIKPQDTEDISAQKTNALQNHFVGVAERPKMYNSGDLTSTNLPDTPVPFEDDFDDELSDDELDISRMSTTHLMRLSGMMQAIKVKRQTGAYPTANFYRDAPISAVSTVPEATATPRTVAKSTPRWKAMLLSPMARIIISLIAGFILLFLTVRTINISATVQTIQHYLLTPLGITYALISGVIFIASFTIRGIRWKLFLNPIGKISTMRVIQLFWIGVFINFLLPVRGGELAKSLMLKRIANMPISQTLPTVAMDKALDLMPALFVIAIVPLLPGVHMTFQLWFVLIVVSSILVGLIIFIALAVWKRTAAIGFMKLFTRFLPKKLSSGVEGFATGFVDSLLAGASRPKIFIPAMLLTVAAVICDGLFALFAFWAVGLYMPFGMAIFGYTVYNMFCILPNAPAGIGSNEATGGIVFTGLLGYNSNSVQAMFIFSHPWTTILMAIIAIASLSSLGLTIGSAMKMRVNVEEKEPAEQKNLVQNRPVSA